MSQSLIRNYVHIIFSTKNRYPFIDNAIKEELFSYVSGVCRALECTPLIVGGHLDHLHILCLLSQKIPLMKLLQETKGQSSGWMKTKGELYENFYWQAGYGCFSVNPTEVEIVRKYILTQEEHHTGKTFQQEYLSFLKKYQVEYDERYIWD